MENRDLIIKNALKLFSKKGYEAAGVQELCEISGITKPTLYYYFKSKSGILEYIIQTKGKEHLNILQEALTYRHDFIKGLTDALIAEINFALDNQDFYNLHCILMNSPDGSEERNAYSKMIDKMQKTFDEFFLSSANEFGNMRGKETLYSRLFLNNITSTAVLITKKKLKYTEEIIYQIIHSMVYGMAN